MEDSVVRNISIHDILNSKSSLPFTTRSAWRQIQHDCPDLRRVHAHLNQGTRPSKKLTNIRDVKRYLSSVSIASDGLLVVKHTQPFVPVAEAIVVPRSVLDGLLTALHIKLNHPTRHQFQMVLQRQFFALDMNDAISRVTSACHTCASLKSFPSSLVKQSSDDPPEVVGVSFAADVIKRYRQLILVLRECTTSFTASCLVHDEKHDTLRDALTQLIVGLHPLDGPRAIIRVDPSPGFQSMANNDSLNHLNVTIDVGRVKNKNKNPVAEKAVRELEEELIRQEPGGRPVSADGLAPPLPVSTPVTSFLAYHRASCGLNAISSPTNSCRCLITTSYLVNTSNVPLTMPPVRSLRTPAVLFQTRLHYTLATLCTSFPIRTSLARVIAISWFPLTSLGASLRSLVVHN